MKLLCAIVFTFSFLTTRGQEVDSTSAMDSMLVDFGEEVFLNVDEPAMPVGGYSAFYEYIGMNVRYPKDARNARATGKVMVEFVVEKDGSISRESIKVLKSPRQSLSDEAIRLMRGAPHWVPGKKGGVTVRTKKVLPITFKLG